MKWQKQTLLFFAFLSLPQFGILCADGLKKSKHQLKSDKQTNEEKKMIAITTMDAIPNLCYECPCHDGENGMCNVDKEKRYTSEYRPYWCPLQSVQNKPDPYINLRPHTYALHVDSKLKPCPFCGNATALIMEEVHDKLDDVEFLQFRIVCDASYEGCGGASGFKSSKEKAIKAWNERK